MNNFSTKNELPLVEEFWSREFDTKKASGRLVWTCWLLFVLKRRRWNNFCIHVHFQPFCNQRSSNRPPGTFNNKGLHCCNWKFPVSLKLPRSYFVRWNIEFLCSRSWRKVTTKIFDQNRQTFLQAVAARLPREQNFFVFEPFVLMVQLDNNKEGQEPFSRTRGNNCLKVEGLSLSFR